MTVSNEGKLVAFEKIASELAPSIKHFARGVYPDSCAFISLERGFVERKIIEFVKACVSAGTPKKIGELVRVHFNVPHESSATKALRLQLRLLIEPFIEGVGEVRVDDTPEGVVIASLDLGKIK
jgi:hypothetical protein